MKVLLVSNYEPAGQESMLRFADVLARGLETRGHDVRIARAPALIGPFAKGIAGAVGADFSYHGRARWFAQADKYLLFPPLLAARARWADVVHICDHSNASYSLVLPRSRLVVTCHDMLGIRGALGEDIDCPSTPLGRVLQRENMRGLCRAHLVVCDSSATREDFVRLAGERRQGDVETVLLGHNRVHTERTRAEAQERIGPRLSHHPFLLHVGSSHRRKNRRVVIEVLARLAETTAMRAVFVGEPLDDDSRRRAGELGILDRVIELGVVDDDRLDALYGAAFALFYPSRFEGFGWPLIEAQACGCPTVCSSGGPFAEVVGDSALMRASDDISGFVEALQSLHDERTRAELVRRGRANVQRFGTERMIDDYERLYERVLARDP